MKELWLDNNQCTGCGACANICPSNAISIIMDKTGFYYPSIGESCIRCNLCEKVCMRRYQTSKQNFTEPRCFAAWSLDKDTRFSSTSGGIFSEIAKVVLKEAGCVVGAIYDDNLIIRHSIASTEEELYLLRQSKYSQSYTGDIFIKTRHLLDKGNKVCFAGTPCQIAALYAFLGGEYANLITIDFICRGVNSPKAFRYWIDEIEKDNKSKVQKVWFKYKENGWKKSPLCTRIDFKNGITKIYDQKENQFMVGYLGPNLYVRPSCENCEFKGVPRQADITLADFWGIEKEYDDDKGTSLVIINNLKGELLFKEISSSIFVIEKCFKDIAKDNRCFYESIKINPLSSNFLNALGDMPFSKALKKYNRRPFYKRVYNRLCRYLSW
jgi:coenzyme F420-reducing hydrogenase beta subunit